MSRLGRALQLLGALAMTVSPFLAWAEVTIFGSHLGVPGIFLHGAVLLGAGTIISTAVLVGVRLPGFHALLSLLAAYATYSDRVQILTRTEYVMGRVQLWLADINNFIAKLSLPTIEVFQKASTTADYVGQGVTVAFAGCTLVLLGTVLEAAGYQGQGKSFASSFVGRPACNACGTRVAHSMRYCPGCGARQGGQNACAGCGAVLKQEHRFCFDCGRPVEEARTT
ncbi:MAG: zinc ribbon domain-containing protein [Candidatus Eremiobacteraeota bacterium]|nr:zinc ribbon domain-containing protein [Candidatus Eremiobacteraeota bacterium]